MKLSQKDLCDSCLKLILHEGTFGEFIQNCLDRRGGSFTHIWDFMLTCDIIITNLESKGGCSMCINRMNNIKNTAQI